MSFLWELFAGSPKILVVYHPVHNALSVSTPAALAEAESYGWVVVGEL